MAQASQLTVMKRREGFRLFFFVLPFMAVTFIFSYFPLWGWVYAFFNYKPGLPLSARNFVGLENFRMIFMDEWAVKDIVRVMTNTLGMHLIGIVTSPIGMIYAILLNEIKNLRYRKTVQTVTTIPNFISWVLVYAIAYAMFAVDDGLVNRVLMDLGLIKQSINFLASEQHVWLKMWAWGTWKGLGWGSIVYIAAIQGIDQELYEAAKVDGAGRFACIWHITVPCLLPTYIVLLILSISNFIRSGMDQYYVFQNPMTRARIEVLELYVFNQGIAGTRYSYSIAIGMLQSVVSLILLTITNTISKFIREESVF
jgi:putative aldouronate transport system permease protein